MAFVRSERFAAMLLVVAAALGLLLANTAAAATAAQVKSIHFGIPALGIDLSLEHWVKDGLLAVFFFIAAIELQHELRHGELDSVRKAVVPTIAAIGGVIVPAIVYLLLARGPGLAQGWPIPTATDIAFALGVLAIVGRGLPPRFRALLLALAVIDDLIAILIIAIFFTAHLAVIPLLLAIPVVAAFAWLSRPALIGRHKWLIAVLVLLGLVTWVLVYQSGVHPTIAGVALGLVMADPAAGRTRHAVEPWSNLLVLPLFALVAALVPVPTSSVADLSPAFWAVLIALPVGKLIGVTLGALVAANFTREPRETQMPLGDVIAVAGLAGIGFTVSLLMNDLAFAAHEDIANQITLAVLLASVIAALIGGSLTAQRSRHYRRTSSTD